MAQQREPETPFWKEQTRWPLVHATFSLAIYFLTRDIVLALLLVYVWESIEYVLSRIFPYFKESRGDSVFGDPLVDALSIFAFWILDQATEWDDVLLNNVSSSRRLWCFIVLVPFGLLVEVGQSAQRARCDPHIGSLLFLLAYIGVVLAFFASLFSELPALMESVLVWLIFVVFYGLFVIPYFVSPSPWVRIVFAEVLSVVGAAITLVAFNP